MASCTDGHKHCIKPALWCTAYYCILLKSPGHATGIPSLVIVDENGEVITTNGQAAIMEDPDGAVSALYGCLHVQLLSIVLLEENLQLF